MSELLTRPSTPRLSEAARHVVIPDGIVTTAWPRIVEQCAEMGVEFDEWQHGVGSVAFGKRADGKYAATVGGVVLSIPRQVGKTFLVGMIVVALCILYPDTTVLWTAHRTRMSTQTFKSMQGVVKRPRIKPHLAADRNEGIRRANSEQEISFFNGSVIMFGAREDGFGRGFDKVDFEVFDEAQKLPEKALEDMVPATNQSQHPGGALLFFMGTPPTPYDRGENFTLRRDEALSGKSKDMFFVELSADADADPDDREQWAKANPSFPERTPVEAMERMRANLKDNQAFLREGLGVWHAAGSAAVIPAEFWSEQADMESMPVDKFALGVEVAPDAERASVVLAGQRDDGGWHVELNQAREGVAWVGPYVEKLVKENPQIRGIGVDPKSAIQVLIEERLPKKWYLTGTDVRVIVPRVEDLAAACTTVLSGVVSGELWHIDQGQLNVAVSSAGKRAWADTGMWFWSRASTASDITPVQALTLALWVAQLDKMWQKPLRKREGTSERRAVML